MRAEEGNVECAVPEQDGDGVGDDVFFNSVQELNRDVTVAALRAYREREPRAESYLDATAASGIRGVRAAAEGWETTCADIDEDAVALAAENLARNDLDGEVRHRDANPLLHEEYFDVVDIDPFGTPIPFIDAACQGTRNLLCLTATDTAPLCGAHFHSGVRSYGAVPRNTEYHAEMGLRVLVSALVRTAARYDLAARPLLSHASDHYARTYLRLESGATPANEAVDDLGYVHHCPDCLYREHEHGLVADAPDACPNCGASTMAAGPLYLAGLHDAAFVRTVRGHVDDEMGTAAEAREMLATIAEELDRPTHYDQHRLCKAWGRPATAMEDFLAALRAAGHDASRTHYGGTTFETDADVARIGAVTGEDG